MYLNNQDIMVYGSDEEKSLSVVGITSGSLVFPDGVITSHYLDFSSYKFRKLLFASKESTTVTLDADYLDMTFNANNTQFTQRITSDLGPSSQMAGIIRQYAEYYPFNVRGVTVTAENNSGAPTNLDYNFAFFA